MPDTERLSLDGIRAFLEGSDELRFEAGDRRERYMGGADPDRAGVCAIGLAREMTADLQAIRDTIPPGGSASLITKGVSFG